jgi:hypothetical protein
MPKHVWTMCCENVVVDARTNNASLINLVEQFNVLARAPVIAFRLFIASYWQRTEEEGPLTFRCRFSWRGGEGEPSLIAETEAVIEAEKRGSRLFLEVDRLEFRGPGDYCIVTELEGAHAAFEVVSTYPVMVRVTD